ncbi:MAG TPA: hypothetical protein DDY88_07740 [Actinobacteria bacterium]|nr:hypothetical protein [Actinomycetota bacterium]
MPDRAIVSNKVPVLALIAPRAHALGLEVYRWRRSSRVPSTPEVGSDPGSNITAKRVGSVVLASLNSDAKVNAVSRSSRETPLPSASVSSRLSIPSASRFASAACSAPFHVAGWPVANATWR